MAKYMNKTVKVWSKYQKMPKTTGNLLSDVDGFLHLLTDLVGNVKTEAAGRPAFIRSISTYTGEVLGEEDTMQVSIALRYMIQDGEVESTDSKSEHLLVYALQTRR